MQSASCSLRRINAQNKKNCSHPNDWPLTKVPICISGPIVIQVNLDLIQSNLNAKISSIQLIAVPFFPVSLSASLFTLYLGHRHCRVSVAAVAYSLSLKKKNRFVWPDTLHQRDKDEAIIEKNN